MPKVDLHVHLEGSIQPATVLQLAQRNNISLPSETVSGLREWFVYRDFEQFRTVIRTCAQCLVHSEDYELATYALGQDMARQNIRYAEVRFGPTTPYFRGIAQRVYMDGLSLGRRRVMGDFGVGINWIFELGRGPDQNTQTWDYTTQGAVEGMNSGVVALGLSGPEYRLQTGSFAPWFDRGRMAGLASAPHAGEFSGSAGVWEAVQILHADRIGHGVRAVEDPVLTAHLAEHEIPLEICPTSNVRLSVYPDLMAHPLPTLHRMGVPVTINSDDPALFNTTLKDELQLLHDPFELDVAAVDTIVLNGVRHSFLPAAAKRELEADVRAELAALKCTHLEGHRGS